MQSITELSIEGNAVFRFQRTYHIDFLILHSLKAVYNIATITLLHYSMLYYYLIDYLEYMFGDNAMSNMIWYFSLSTVLAFATIFFVSMSSIFQLEQWAIIQLSMSNNVLVFLYMVVQSA